VKMVFCLEAYTTRKLTVLVQFSWATSDLWLIQHWISHRSMVAQLNCTVTKLTPSNDHKTKSRLSQWCSRNAGNWTRYTRVFIARHITAVTKYDYAVQ